MKTSLLRSVAAHLILAMSIFLVFLVVFDEYLRIPELLLFLGRLHPVILHFPIVLLVLAIINSFTRHQHHQHLILTVTAIFTLITAITGFLLSEENSTKGTLLSWHQWLGTVVALLTAAWYGIFETKGKGARYPISLGIRISILFLIIVTGHFGGMITHGRDFLSWNRNKADSQQIIPEDPLVFEDLVLPILERKCVSCHNVDKTKGGLILTDLTMLLKGGESGPNKNPEDSELIRRIHLPIDHEDHMPPSDQQQLSVTEVDLLVEWALKGYPEDLPVSYISDDEDLYVAVRNFMYSGKPSKWDHLPVVDESYLIRLSSDYITIRRLEENSNALSVSMFPNPEFNTERLTVLQPILHNIVELDLSYLPIEKEDMEIISRCESLEWLEIDFTPVDDEEFLQLGTLDQLRILKAQGSGLTEKSLVKLSEFKNLEKIFLWDTEIHEEKLATLNKSRPGLTINTGMDENITFISTLPRPAIKSEQTFFIDYLDLEFDHPLSDINVFYTLNGNDPKSDGRMYSSPFRIDNSCNIKFMASKEGWESSPVDSLMIIKTLKGPDKARLRYPPDPKYPGRGATGLFDLIKGPSQLQDSTWLGFQKEIMHLECEWNEEVRFKAIMLSSIINPGAHVFPPTRIEILGGHRDEMQQIGYLIPSRLTGYAPVGYRYYTCPVDPLPVTRLEIIVTPLAELPGWHASKGEPGWFFADEVVLVE